MIKTSVLKNGIRLITEEVKGAQTVAFGVWVGVGSRYEKKEERGISHFLEHMAFKGTTTRSALKIAQEIENVGGFINAYTGKDMTAYYVHLLKDDLPIGLDIIADILQHATMDAKELAMEKGVIIQEINMYKDQPEYVAGQNFDETAYPDQPFGWDTAGEPDVIQGMTSKKLLDYMHRHYTAQRMIISASGGVKHEELLQRCEAAFSNISTCKPSVCLPAKYVGGASYVRTSHEQVNLFLGFEGEKYTSENYWTAKILGAILGGGMTSRLFQEIREKRGLVYLIRAMSNSDADTGMLSIYAGTGEKEAGELMPVLCDEILRVADTLTDEEIRRAKTQIKAQLMMKNEEIASRAERNAHSMLYYNRVIEDSEILDRVRTVNQKTLQEYAWKFFIKKPTVAALGPISHLMSYDDICARLKG